MRPLISIGVKCCNQVGTIGAALEAAFAQDYRPLEIVVGDDASTDGSWEEINRVVAAHANEAGIAAVVFRNRQNLGNLGNWMEVCAHAHGAWLVKADGDDISLPGRISRIADALEANPNAVALMHAVYRVVDGRRVGVRHPRSPVSPLGAGMAFARACYAAFPPHVVHGRLMDDEVFARRARMLGEMVLLDEPLVDYAAGGVSFDADDALAAELRCTRLQPATVEQALVDLECVRERLGDTRADALAAEFRDEAAESCLRVTLMSSPRFAERWHAWRRMKRPSVTRPGYWKYALCLLPHAVATRCLACLARLRRRLTKI